MKDEKRLKKQNRRKEIEELTRDDPWFACDILFLCDLLSQHTVVFRYVKFRRIICCENQPGHKRTLKEEQQFIYHVKNEDIFAVKDDLDKRSDPNFRFVVRG